MAEEAFPEYKVVVCGSGGTGKSCLTNQFITGFFTEDYDPTIEDSYTTKVSVDDEKGVLDVLDTAGQEEYSAMLDEYMRHGQGFIIVYSITSVKSFQEVQKYHEKLTFVKDLQPGDSCPLILVANKADLEDKRQVATADGAALAAQFGCPFIEASAKTCTNVHEVFHQVVREVRKHRAATGQAATMSKGPDAAMEAKIRTRFSKWSGWKTMKKGISGMFGRGKKDKAKAGDSNVSSPTPTGGTGQGAMAGSPGAGAGAGAGGAVPATTAAPQPAAATTPQPVIQPVAAQPVAAQPVAAQPVAAQPVAAQPVTAVAPAGQPAGAAPAGMGVMAVAPLNLGQPLPVAAAPTAQPVQPVAAVQPVAVQPVAAATPAVASAPAPTAQAPAADAGGALGDFDLDDLEKQLMSTMSDLDSALDPSSPAPAPAPAPAAATPAAVTPVVQPVAAAPPPAAAQPKAAGATAPPAARRMPVGAQASPFAMANGAAPAPGFGGAAPKAAPAPKAAVVPARPVVATGGPNIAAPAPAATPAVGGAASYGQLPKENFTAHKWFHGTMGGPEADGILARSPPGTFLIRYSSQPSHLAVSYVDGGEVQKALIGYNDTGFWMDEPSPTVYNTLEDLVNASAAALRIPYERGA